MQDGSLACRPVPQHWLSDHSLSLLNSNSLLSLAPSGTKPSHGSSLFSGSPYHGPNFLALMRAFQHLTVAIEHVLSSPGHPLPPQDRVLATSQRGNGVLGFRASHSDAATFNGGPIMMLAPWTLIPGSLPARTCSALWFSNTSLLVGARGGGGIKEGSWNRQA